MTTKQENKNYFEWWCLHLFAILAIVFRHTHAHLCSRVSSHTHTHSRGEICLCAEQWKYFVGEWVLGGYNLWPNLIIVFFSLFVYLNAGFSVLLSLSLSLLFLSLISPMPNQLDFENQLISRIEQIYREIHMLKNWFDERMRGSVKWDT